MYDSLGTGSPLGEKGKKIGERSKPRGSLVDHSWARFARRIFFYFTRFLRLVPGYDYEKPLR